MIGLGSSLSFTANSSTGRSTVAVDTTVGHWLSTDPGAKPERQIWLPQTSTVHIFATPDSLGLMRADKVMDLWHSSPLGSISFSCARPAWEGMFMFDRPQELLKFWKCILQFAFPDVLGHLQPSPTFWLLWPTNTFFQFQLSQGLQIPNIGFRWHHIKDVGVFKFVREALSEIVGSKRWL